MKIKIIALVGLLAALVSSSPAAELMEVGKRHYGLGLASMNFGGGSAAMITGWIPYKSSMGFQPYFGIPSTTGGFSFLAGSAFKVTVSGNSQAAFHLGCDLVLGSLMSKFSVGFGGLLGVHYAPAQGLLFSIDGGPQFTIFDGATNFSVGALSGLLGASLIYLF